MVEMRKVDCPHRARLWVPQRGVEKSFDLIRRLRQRRPRRPVFHSKKRVLSTGLEGRISLYLHTLTLERDDSFLCPYCPLEVGKGIVRTKKCIIWRC
jgi:hypothetical protein